MGVRKTSYSCLLLLAVVLAVQIQLDAADDEGLGGFDWCANACELDLEKAFGSDGKDLNFGQTDPSICPDFCIPFLREVFADTPLTSEAASAAEEDPFAVLAEPSNFEDAFKIPARFEESFPSECVDECEFNVAKAFESEGKEIIFGPPKPNTCSGDCEANFFDFFTQPTVWIILKNPPSIFQKELPWLKILLTLDSPLPQNALRLAKKRMQKTLKSALPLVLMPLSIRLLTMSGLLTMSRLMTSRMLTTSGLPPACLAAFS